MPTTGKGFPYPSSSDNPDIPGDFQALAEAIDNHFDDYATTDANTTYHLEVGVHSEDEDFDIRLVGSDSTIDLFHFAGENGLSVTIDEEAQKVTFSLDADLTAIAALAGTSGLLKKTAADTWELDTSTYLTSADLTIDGLSDVVLTDVADGQVLKYDESSGTWINADDNLGTSGGAGTSFTTIAVPAGTNPAADSETDTLTLFNGDGISITGNSTADSVTIAVNPTSYSNWNTAYGWGNHASVGYLTSSSPTINTPLLTLSTLTSVDEGRLAWDSTNDKIIIGNGSTASEFASSTLKTNAQTGTTYTVVLADKDKLVELSNASAITLTVPLNSSVAYPVGTQINLLQTGAGQVTVAGISGVTVNATPGLKLRTQWSSATLIKRATDTWVLVGDLSA